MQDTPYHREILILQSVLTKLAAQNPNEDLNLTHKLSQKLVSNAFSGYFEDYEKQKIKEAVTYLKDKEQLELPYIQNDLTQMLNSVAPAKDYFERNIINREHRKRCIDFIEQKFAKISKKPKKTKIPEMPEMTNSELMAIAKEQKNIPIQITNKDFSNVFLENIKLLFGKSKYRENHDEYLCRDIIFSNCIFHNLNLSNMHFKSNVSFKECIFNGNTDFRNSVFEQDVSFNRSNFIGTTHFEDTNFLKNADFEYIKTNGYAFLFNQYKLDNSQNDDWFRYLWSFKGAEFNSNVAFFRRIFPARVNFSYVKFNNIFYFTDCKFPLKIEAKCFDFSPKNIPDFETSIRTVRVALEECYCNYAKDDLLIWEKKAYETSNKTIIDDEKRELLSPRVTAAILGYSEASLRTMRCQYPDKIKFVKRGNRVYYYKSSIDEFIKLTPPKKK